MAKYKHVIDRLGVYEFHKVGVGPVFRPRSGPDQVFARKDGPSYIGSTGGERFHTWEDDFGVSIDEDGLVYLWLGPLHSRKSKILCHAVETGTRKRIRWPQFPDGIDDDDS